MMLVFGIDWWLVGLEEKMRFLGRGYCSPDRPFARADPNSLERIKPESFLRFWSRTARANPEPLERIQIRSSESSSLERISTRDQT